MDVGGCLTMIVSAPPVHEVNEQQPFKKCIHSSEWKLYAKSRWEVLIPETFANYTWCALVYRQEGAPCEEGRA